MLPTLYPRLGEILVCVNIFVDPFSLWGLVEGLVDKDDRQIQRGRRKRLAK